MSETVREPRPQASAASPPLEYPAWCKRTEATRLSGLGKMKLYELVANGTVQSRKIGVTRLYRVLDLLTLTPK